MCVAFRLKLGFRVTLLPLLAEITILVFSRDAVRKIEKKEREKGKDIPVKRQFYNNKQQHNSNVFRATVAFLLALQWPPGNHSNELTFQEHVSGHSCATWV